MCNEPPPGFFFRRPEPWSRTRARSGMPAGDGVSCCAWAGIRRWQLAPLGVAAHHPRLSNSCIAPSTAIDAKARSGLIGHRRWFTRMLRGWGTGVKLQTVCIAGTSRPDNLHIAPAFHRLEHGDFVGVFDIAANGNAHGDARHPQTLAFELLGKISGSGFSFDRRVGGEDHLFNVVLCNAAEQVGNGQLLPPKALK